VHESSVNACQAPRGEINSHPRSPPFSRVFHERQCPVRPTAGKINGGTVSTAIAARQRAEGTQLVAYAFICLAKIEF